MSLLEKDESHTFSQGGTHDKYRRWIGKYPNLFRICCRNAFVVRRSGEASGASSQAQRSEQNPRKSALCAKAFWALRRDRFSGGTLRLYHQRGTHRWREFYERLQPFATPFIALFERDQFPSRSALSRFLAALTEEPVEALRTLFLDDLLARPLTPDKQIGGLVDRQGNTWTVFDIDGTREAARQRALPQTNDLPPAFRRLDGVCAPGYRGRKRGEVVRTRTTVSQAHSYQWLGSFGNRGNGRYREELRKGIAAIGRYLAAHQFPQERTLIRLDGQYGNGAVLSDVAGFAFVTRGKDYHLLDHPLVQARLHLPPDQVQQRPESQMVRSRYDCPEIPVGPEGTLYRVIVATHLTGKKKSPIGATRKGVVYELFFTNLPQQAFTACDVVELYLHRGAFEPILSDAEPISDLEGGNWRQADRITTLIFPFPSLFQSFFPYSSSIFSTFYK
jgi:hypothetical protein